MVKTEKVRKGGELLMFSLLFSDDLLLDMLGGARLSCCMNKSERKYELIVYIVLTENEMKP